MTRWTGRLGRADVGRLGVDGAWLGHPGPTAVHNLSESTPPDLDFGNLLDSIGGVSALRGIGLGYGPTVGDEALRVAVARCCGVPAETVLTTQGTMLGLALVAAELCRAGDDALLVTPCFAPMRGAMERHGARVRRIALSFEDGYRLDPARVAAALRPETRLVALATPQNPSGVRVPQSAQRAILDAMATRAPDALLLLDVTYREATYGEASPPSSAGLDPRVVTVGSLSKAHGVPGLRIGWLTVPDAGLRDRLVAAKLDLVIAGSTLDEAIGAALLARGEAVLAPCRRHLAGALAAVAAWREGEGARLDWIAPDAGALCCCRLRGVSAAEGAVARFWAALPGRGVRLAPGRWFGEPDSLFRIGFGHLPPADLGPALRAISGAMDEAGPVVRTAAPG